MTAEESRKQEFIEMVQKNQETVRAFLARHVDDLTVADDLAQEVFLGAYRNWDRVQVEDEKAWLAVIARNHLMSYWRKKRTDRKRKDAVREMVRQELVEQMKSAGIDHAADTMNAMRQCLEGMPEKSKTLIHRRFALGESAKGIAQALQRGESSVRMALMRIRAALKRCVQGRLGEEGSS